MERIKRIGLRLLYPGGFWMLLSTVLAVPALVVTFTTGKDGTPFGIASYVVSAYALTTLACGMPRIVRRGKVLLNQNRHSRRYLLDLPFRVWISLHASLVVNILFALFKLATGILYSSLWFGAVAVYYLILCAARLFLLWNFSEIEDNPARQYRKYRFCGGLLFLLNFALMAMVVQMVFSGKGYAYPGTFIYAFAAYAFAMMAQSVINIIRYRKLNSPVLMAAKMLNFATALVAMLSLQTAMFASFGEDVALQRLMNGLTGAAVCVIILGMGLWMTIHAGKRLQHLQDKTTGGVGNGA